MKPIDIGCLRAEYSHVNQAWIVRVYAHRGDRMGPVLRVLRTESDAIEYMRGLNEPMVRPAV